jgi:hypothetical protein
VLVSLGYAGWEAGQLEDEIAQNAWLTVPADPRIFSRCRRKTALMQPCSCSASISPTSRTSPGTPEHHGDRRRGLRLWPGAASAWRWARPGNGPGPPSPRFRRSQRAALRCIGKLIEEWKPQRLVVGCPPTWRQRTDRDDGALPPLRQPAQRPLRAAGGAGGRAPYFRRSRRDACASRRWAGANASNISTTPPRRILQYFDKRRTMNLPDA